MELLVFFQYYVEDSSFAVVVIAVVVLLSSVLSTRVFLLWLLPFLLGPEVSPLSRPRFCYSWQQSKIVVVVLFGLCFWIVLLSSFPFKRLPLLLRCEEFPLSWPK